jgi:hypothetical protein
MLEFPAQSIRMCKGGELRDPQWLCLRNTPRQVHKVTAGVKVIHTHERHKTAAALMATVDKTT